MNVGLVAITPTYLFDTSTAAIHKIHGSFEGWRLIARQGTQRWQVNCVYNLRVECLKMADHSVLFLDEL